MIFSYRTPKIIMVMVSRNVSVSTNYNHYKIINSNTINLNFKGCILKFKNIIYSKMPTRCQSDNLVGANLKEKCFIRNQQHQPKKVKIRVLFRCL